MRYEKSIKIRITNYILREVIDEPIFATTWENQMGLVGITIIKIGTKYDLCSKNKKSNKIKGPTLEKYWAIFVYFKDAKIQLSFWDVQLSLPFSYFLYLFPL